MTKCNRFLLVARKLKGDFKRGEVLVPARDGTRLRKALPFALPDKTAFEFAELDPEGAVVEPVHENGTRVSAELEGTLRATSLALPLT